jgi:hypothetical protein
VAIALSVGIVASPHPRPRSCNRWGKENDEAPFCSLPPRGGGSGWGARRWAVTHPAYIPDQSTRMTPRPDRGAMQEAAAALSRISPTLHPGYACRMLSDEEWYLFAVGGIPGPVPVCRLAPDLARLVGLEAGIVRIARPYAQKLRFKHKLAPEEFRMLPATLQLGTVLQQDRNRLLFFRNREPRGVYQAVVKATNSGSELWVATFHRQSNSEFARKSRRYTFIRASTE